MAKAIPLTELPVFDQNTGNHFNVNLFTSGAAILMDKPLEWTSFDVVSFVRNRIPPKKVGHAGTLDPLATGLLILCSGRATKSISQFQDLPKTYEATVRFGASTPSYDAATEPDNESSWEHITLDKIKTIIENDFTGNISQIPPMYSAIKVKGQRLYKLARKGKKIKVQPRSVQIHNIEIMDSSLPDLKIRVKCGKGTYIRSLAHDLGIALGSHAHLTQLIRTEIGHFHVKNALGVQEFQQVCNDLVH